MFLKDLVKLINSFTPKTAAAQNETVSQKIVCKILKNKQRRRRELLSSFHLNGHTLGFHPQTQKLEPPCL